MWLVPIQNRFLRNASFSAFLRCERQISSSRRGWTYQGMTPTALVLVSKRNFGQGERIRIFGHAKSQSRSKYPNFMPLILAIPLSMFMYTLNWAKIKHDYFGIGDGKTSNMHSWMDKFFNQGGVGDNTWDMRTANRNKNERLAYQGLQMDVEENKAELHEYMKKQALSRYNTKVEELIAQDPELQALVDGKDETTIKVGDKEAFELKKVWVKDYLKSVKAETVDLDPDDFALEHEDLESISDEEDLSMGFKARKIIEYENRIRQYSTPDKIFR